MKNSHKLPTSIGIVGLGLIGGSLALDFQSLGIRVHGLVHRSQTAQRAIDRGLAEVISTDYSVLSDCEVVFIALPIEKLINPSLELINALPKNAVITDVGSVKGPILKVWRELHPLFVASHPMAGTASSGVDSGHQGLFNNKPWVLTPDEKTDSHSLDVIKNLVFNLGSKLIITEAERHDEVVSLISHLPVLVSAALLRTLGEQRDPNIIKLSKELASTGFKDTTRVGGGNPELGTSMSANNTQAILRALSFYRWNLEKLEEVVLSGNWNQLYEELNYSKSIRLDYVKNMP